jgi:hypothetical protein
MNCKLLLASAGAFALTASAAIAADLGYRQPPPPYLPPPPLFTWTGIYIGGQIGYAWAPATSTPLDFDPVTGAFVSGNLGSRPNGVIGGAHLGYQYQFNQFVLGIEGSVDGTSLSNTAVAAFPVAFGGSTLTAHSTADVQGSIRGKAGIDRLGPGDDLWHGRRCLRLISRLRHRTLSRHSSLPPTLRARAPAGRQAGGFNSPSRTIGGSMANTASPISARLGTGLSPMCRRACSSTAAAVCRRTRCRRASATNSTPMRQPRLSPNTDGSCGDCVDAKKPGCPARFCARHFVSPYLAGSFLAASVAPRPQSPK